MCEFISPDVVNGNFTLEAPSPAVLSLAYGDSLACAAQNMGNFELLFNGKGSMQTEGGLSILDESGPVKTRRILSASEGQITVQTKYPGNSIHSEDEAAAKFLFLMAQKDYAGAWELMSGNLRSQLAENEIISFIGQIDGVMPCRYIPGVKQPSYAGKVKLKSNIYSARPFVFNMNSDMEIVNITPV